MWGLFCNFFQNILNMRLWRTFLIVPKFQNNISFYILCNHLSLNNLYTCFVRLFMFFNIMNVHWIHRVLGFPGLGASLVNEIQIISHFRRLREVIIEAVRTVLWKMPRTFVMCNMYCIICTKIIG